jgi:hypothetical protein
MYVFLFSYESQIIVTKLSEIWTGMFIPHPDIFYPGYRIRIKSNGSRIQIRNTQFKNHPTKWARRRLPKLSQIRKDWIKNDWLHSVVDPDPRLRIKKFRYFLFLTPKIAHCSGFFLSRILTFSVPDPNPWSRDKKARDPGSGPATLKWRTTSQSESASKQTLTFTDF